MMKSLIRLTIIFFFIILWVLNPISFVSFEDIVNNQSISQSQEITYVRGGAFDPLQKKARELTSPVSTTSNSGEQVAKPPKDSSSMGKGLKYRPLPGSGAGSGNDNFDDSGPSSQKQNLDEICSEHPSFYSDKKKSDEQCELEEEVKSEVKIDFDFVSDQKGDPILLIPDNNSLLADKDRFIKVDHEQTKTHLHHAEDLGINLPDDFDMNHYENLDREGRIDYANQNVPCETIIECQNEIGKVLTENNPTHVDGFIGKYKKDADFKINTQKKIISVVSEQGQHISTYSVTPNKLRRIVKDGFWIWKNRNI